MRANERDNYIWNTVGSLCYSLLSLLLLLIVNRVRGESEGGVFALAFSHSQMMYYIATLEARPLHSTDVDRKYSFGGWFTLRGLSCGVMIAASLGYALLMDGDPFKKRIVMYLCVFKALEALEDVFTALFQQRGRIAWTGKEDTVWSLAALISFTGTLLLTGNLEIACLVMIATGAVTLLTLNLWIWRKFDDAEIRFRPDEAKRILPGCLPLFISAFVMLLISNAPKYAINALGDDVIQNRYGILFMPAFIINMFSQFIFRPRLTDLATAWNGHETGRFEQTCRRILLVIGGLTLAGMAGAYLIGIPILEMLYGADLSGEKGTLVLVMVYGGLNAVSMFLYYLIAVIREQKWLPAAYAVSAALVLLTATALVNRLGTGGAILASILAMGALNLTLGGIFLKVIRKRKQEERGERA